MAAEYRCLSPLLARHPRQVLAAHAGMGPERAQCASRRLVEAGAAALVSFGFAGGLDPALGAGTLIVVAEVSEPGGRRVGTLAPVFPEGLLDGLGGRKLLTAPAEVESVSEKAAVRAATSASAVDLESFVVAQTAAELGVGFIAIRAVLDGGRRALPAGLSGCVDAYGHLRPAAFAGWLLRHPHRAAALPGLAGAEWRAKAALRAASRRIADGLDALA